MDIATAATDIDHTASPSSRRSQRRARARLRRAVRRFSRTEVALERAVASTLALAEALQHAIEHPESTDVVVGDVIVRRNELPEYIAMTQHDMRTAARRRRCAAAAVARERGTLDEHATTEARSAA